MRRRALALSLLAVLPLATCGGITAPDLFIVERSGSVPDARLTLLVNEEGGVSCNGAAMRGGRKLKLSDAALVEARAIQEDLKEPASARLSLAPAPRSVLSYLVRDEDGTVRFSDNSPGQPAVLHRLALFVLQTSQRVCGLPL
ncbi:MAG TPA: hypothetical protein VN672_12740 [Solirubrobacteraceae bacterium]|nr:hypothetical protein [Solirubrobacteraceae bacterium]